MEERTVPLLNLTDISSVRASLRRRLSLFDLNLRQVAAVLLTPEQFAKWAGAQPSSDTPLSSRGPMGNPALASPRSAERRFGHLQLGSRPLIFVDRLSLPCRKPHFLGEDFVSQGIDDLFSPSRRSRHSKWMNRLSVLSPRSQKNAEAPKEVATAEMVVASLHELLAGRQALDQAWTDRAPLGRDQLVAQLEVLQAGLRNVGSRLDRFDPGAKVARDLRQNLLRLHGFDETLYGSVLPWIDQSKPEANRLHAVDIADLLRSSLDDAKVLLALHFGLDANEAVAYEREQWPPAPARLPGMLSDRRLLGQPDYGWAAGGMATVHKLTYRSEPEPVSVIWKPENSSAGSLGSDYLGITSNEARGGTAPFYCARAVASYRVDRLLQLNLTPQTEFAVHQGKLGAAMAPVGGLAPSSKGPFLLPLGTDIATALKKLADALPRLANQFRFCSVTWSATAENTLVFDHYVEDFVFDEDGVRLQDANNQPLIQRRRQQVCVVQDFAHPALRRALNRLQWLDHLTGQVDRNPMNYLVDLRSDGNLFLGAIDNDLSFPSVPQLPQMTALNSIWLPSMPEVVDEVMAGAILAVDEKAWGDALHGLLMPSEFQFACTRLAAVQDRIKELMANKRVVTAALDAWAGPELTQLLNLAGLQERMEAATTALDLADLWESSCRHSYLLRDATKQAMVLTGRDPMPYFDPAAIRAYIEKELLKG